MTVGTLHSSITIDRDSRSCFGPTDPVSGNVVLEFKAWDRRKGETGNNELLGPLKVYTILEGVMGTEIDPDYWNRASRPEYRDERKLFEHECLIYDGKLQIDASGSKVFPFKAFFPSHAEPTPQQRKNGVRQEDWDALPASLDTEFSGGHGGGRGFVEYHIHCKLEVLGIDVDIATKGVNPLLQYQPAIRDRHGCNSTTSFEQTFSVANESLIPDSERLQGFRAKAKAMFKDIEPPTYAFDIVCTEIPEVVFPLQSLNFKIAIREDIERTTAPHRPDIILKECTVTITGYCGVRVWPKLRDMIESAEMKDLEDTVVVLGAVWPDRPYSEDSGLTKVVTTPPLPPMPCSFALEGMSRYYKARISVRLEVGGQCVNAQRVYPITVVSRKTERLSGIE